jgi:hypothetical protein
MAIWVVGSAVVLAVYTVFLFGGTAISGVGYGASPLLTALFVLWCAGGVLTATLSLLLHYVVVPREVRAGYTTGYRVHQEVDYVDPSTSHVLRVAGEPFLQSQELRRREALVVQVVASEDAAGHGLS